MRGARLSVALATVLLAGLIPVPAACYGAAKRAHPAPRKVFQNPDRSFSFQYPADFLLCPAGGTRECASHGMLPACTDESLVCAIYPDSVLEGSHVVSAEFEVREVPKSSADDCVTPEHRDGGYPVFQISAAHPVERIGTVTFVHGSDADVAMGTSAEIDYYRAYHRGRCYQLSVTISGSDPSSEDWGDDPESVRAKKVAKALEERNYRMVTVTLDAVLHSFRFTR